MGLFKDWLLREDEFVAGTGLAGPEDNGLNKTSTYVPPRDSKLADKAFGYKKKLSRRNQIRTL